MDYRNYMAYTRYNRSVAFDQDELNTRWAAVRKLMGELHVNLAIVLDGRMEGEGEWLTGLFSPSPEWPSGGMIVPMGGPIFVSMSVRPDVETHGEGFGGIDVTPNPLVVTRQGFVIGDIKDHLLMENRIGLVHPEMMSAELRDEIVKHIPDVVFVDITKPFRRLMVQKTENEIAIFRDAGQMHKKLLRAVGQMVRVGRCESELVKDIRVRAMDMSVISEHIGEDFNIDLTSSPDGETASGDCFLYPGRRLEAGDRVNVRVRAMTPFHAFCNIARCFIIGAPCEETQHDWDMAVRVTELCASLLKAGALLAEVRDAANRFLTENGYERDDTVFLHGIGYAPACYPYCNDESAVEPLAANTCIAVHPHVKRPGKDAFCCGETYLVTADGAERLTNGPQTLVQV